jgi:Predicted nucleic acid-binding protein, contains PIN domain
MKLLIDANILLDVLQKREPHYRDSSMIWKLCETKQVSGYVSTLSFANLVYVMRKELSAEQIEEILRALSLIFEFVELSVSDLSYAAKMKWDNFEDAVQSATAERNHTDYIITRNIRDFKKSSVMALTPAEFIARL